MLKVSLVFLAFIVFEEKTLEMELQSSFFFDFMLLVHIEQTPFDAPALLKSIDLNPPKLVIS